MMEMHVATRSVTDEAGQTRTYRYCLLVELIETDRFTCEDYGVRITEEGGDTAAIRGITISAVRIDELLSLLVDHLVGPTALPDVVQDWL